MQKTGRHKNEPKRPRGTGTASGKDRTVHKAARGKKGTLADLSKEAITDADLDSFAETIRNEPDRSAAIMAASLVERALTDAIRSRLADPGEEITRTWFEGVNAPFQTFSAKIVLGRALAIYGGEMETRLNLIRNVRNAFAHRPQTLDFAHPTLMEACLPLAPEKHRDKEAPRKVIYARACLVLCSLLGKFAEEEGGKELATRFR
jgi:hypothetical protein